MFEKVLFPTDFSTYVDRISECGISSIPGVEEIIILNVIDTKKLAYEEETVELATGKVELILQESKGFLKRDSPQLVNVSSVVKVGIPSREIIKTAHEEGCSLIVMGTRWRSLIKEILLGGVASDVLKYGTTNVLILKHKRREGKEKLDCFYKLMFSKILAPIDFSEQSLKVLPVLERIKGISKLTLVHVIYKAESKSELDSKISEAEEKLDGLAEKFKENYKKKIEINTHIHFGDPIEEINKTAEEENVSVIALSLFDRGRERIAEDMNWKEIIGGKVSWLMGTVT